MNASSPPVSRSARIPAPPATWLWGAALLALAMRLWVAARLPVTGDEAFFYWWGVFPDWGYSDHPPMVGWLIWLMRQTLGDTLGSIRLPIVLLPLLVGGLLAWGFAAVDRERALWGVLLYWLAPLNWLATMITTDTPLIFWSAVAIACYMRADARERLDARAWGLYALVGLAMGGAALSKYFSALLGLAFIVHLLVFRRDRLWTLPVMLLLAAPGPAINLTYNASHCWTNIMFNVYNRNAGETVQLYKPAAYVGMMIYLLSPMLVWAAWRERAAIVGVLRRQRLLATLVVVPFAAFAVLSLKKVIGLHWVLSFWPLLFMLAAMALPADRLRRGAMALAAFTGVHLLVVGGIALTSMDQWKSTRIYPSIVRSVSANQILAQVQAPEVVVMANAYTPASIFGWARREYMPVFGPGRFHARQDDLLVDYSVYEGRTIRVLASEPQPLEDYAPYFDQVRRLQVTQDGATFHVVEGTNFHYAPYRERVLGEIHQRYYAIPTWLPMTDCPFCRRLCGEVRCPR